MFFEDLEHWYSITGMAVIDLGFQSTVQWVLQHGYPLLFIVMLIEGPVVTAAGGLTVRAVSARAGMLFTDGEPLDVAEAWRRARRKGAVDVIGDRQQVADKFRSRGKRA